MNNRFLEALSGALGGGLIGAGSSFVTEPSKKKRNESIKNRALIGAAVGGVGAPLANVIAEKSIPLVRKMLYKGVENPPVGPVNPGSHFMGGLRGLKQEYGIADKVQQAIKNKKWEELFEKHEKDATPEKKEVLDFFRSILIKKNIEKKADYVINKKRNTFISGALAQEIQTQLNNGEGLDDDRVSALINDFTERVGNPGNVIINRGKKTYGGKILEYAEGDKLHKSLKGLDLKSGTNVISEPVERLLVNSMAYAVDPNKSKDISNQNKLRLTRNALIVANRITGILPKKSIRTALKIITGTGAVGAQLAKDNIAYKANVRANDAVKNFYGLSDEDIENDPVLYQKLKKNFLARNMSILGMAITGAEQLPDIDLLPNI